MFQKNVLDVFGIFLRYVAKNKISQKYFKKHVFFLSATLRKTFTVNIPNTIKNFKFKSLCTYSIP